MSRSDVSALPDTAFRSRPALGLPLLASEISVLFRRRRTWAMLASLALIPVLIALAVRLTTSRPPSGRGPAFLDQVSQNGLFVSFVGLLVSVPLFLPLTVGVVAGDTIAGEASSGTLRYLLIAPAGRTRLLIVKYLATAVFCVAATLSVAIAGALIGAALFPIGPVTLLSGDSIAVGDSIVRSLLIAANRIGPEGQGGHGQNFYGHSFIADQWGDFAAEFGREESGILVATLDLDAARRHRAGMGFFRDRRPELYHRLVEDT